MVIDPLDRLWILDTGRVLTPDGKTLVPSSYGGPKLIGVTLSNNTVFQTILFPQDVAFPDSYPNDVRFDLRATVVTERRFDRQLIALSFPPRTEPFVRLLYRVNQARAELTSTAAGVTSLRELRGG